MSAGSKKTKTTSKTTTTQPKNTTLSFLADFCAQHLLDEKILIVPSYQTGHQIGEALTKAGHSWVNWRLATLPSLAHEICAEEISKEKLKQITPHTTSLLVDKAFTALKQGGRLDYFKELESKPGIIKAFSRSIQLLRMQGITSKSLSPQKFAHHFINKKKGMEIHLLLSEYEKLLRDKKLIDKPALYARACEAALTNFARDKHFFGFEDQALTPLEKKFLQKISQDNLIILPGDPVFGIQKPRRFHKVTEPEYAPKKPAADSERTAWLFAPYRAPKPLNDGTLTITTAVGPSNECKEVFRCLIRDKIPVDEAEIICPQGQVYPSLFYTLSQKTGIPVTLSEGLGIGFTSPGKLFSSLLNWMQSDFRDSIFRDLLESGHLSFKKKDKSFPSPHQISALLQRAGIGWGQDRYLSCLERSKEEASGPTIRRINQIIPEIKKIFRFLAPWNESDSIDWQHLARGIHDFLTQYASIKTPQDAEAISALYSRLDDMASFDTPPMPKEDALERLRTLETDLKVDSSGPHPPG